MFFITFILIAIVQYATKLNADVAVLCVGEHPISQLQSEKIAASVASRIEDQNGDDEIFVDIKTIRLYSDFDRLNEGEKIQALENHQSYSTEILSGDACILLLDEYFYLELADSGALVNLYEVFEELPSSAVDYYGLRLKDTPLYALDGFSQLPEDMVVCLKHASVYSPSDLEERVNEDIRNAAMFRSLLMES
jgi:hypothetical protein